MELSVVLIFLAMTTCRIPILDVFDRSTCIIRPLGLDLSLFLSSLADIDPGSWQNVE